MQLHPPIKAAATLQSVQYCRAPSMPIPATTATSYSQIHGQSLWMCPKSMKELPSPNMRCLGAYKLMPWCCRDFVTLWLATTSQSGPLTCWYSTPTQLSSVLWRPSTSTSTSTSTKLPWMRPRKPLTIATSTASIGVSSATSLASFNNYLFRKVRKYKSRHNARE